MPHASNRQAFEGTKFHFGPVAQPRQQSSPVEEIILESMGDCADLVPSKLRILRIGSPTFRWMVQRTDQGKTDCDDCGVCSVDPGKMCKKYSETKDEKRNPAVHGLCRIDRLSTILVVVSGISLAHQHDILAISSGSPPSCPGSERSRQTLDILDSSHTFGFKL